jgi:hypothetical protein
VNGRHQRKVNNTSTGQDRVDLENKEFQLILTKLRILKKIYHYILKRQLRGQKRDRAAQCSSFSQ